jgi:geranylgeranyl pyrophosphate synthase
MRASSDRDAVELNEALTASAASDDTEAFEKYVDELRSSRFAEQTLNTARQWATEAVEGLALLPEGLPKNALVRFATRVIERSS